MSRAALARVSALIAARPEALLMHRLGAIAYAAPEDLRGLIGALAHAALKARAREEAHRFRTGALAIGEWGRFIAAARDEDRNDEHRAEMRDRGSSRDEGTM